jgi:NADPH-dependent 7-cyano-7-deazaguanine reductase QueF-like protein
MIVMEKIYDIQDVYYSWWQFSSHLAKRVLLAITITLLPSVVRCFPSTTSPFTFWSSLKLLEWLKPNIFETTWVIETKHLWNYLSDWNQTSLKLLEWLKPNIFETTWVIETKHLWNYLSNWNQTSLKLLEWLKPNIFETTWVIETKHLWNYLSDWNQASLKLLEWL